jgi:hypothetical protein
MLLEVCPEPDIFRRDGILADVRKREQGQEGAEDAQR